MKKTAILVLIGQFLGAALMVPVVIAQTTVLSQPVVPPLDSGFLQFNNLTIESVSGTNLPAEIFASNPNIFPTMGASGGSTGNNVPQAMPFATPSVTSQVSCYKFDTQNSATGKALPCPTPPPSATTSTAQSALTPMIYPPTYPIRYQPYRIEVDASTRLLLRDRTIAILNNFSSGDQINMFGYYNNDGSIQAYLIRNLSKPVQNEFLQLNNVELVSISANTIPAMLVVTQAQGYPCYGFGNSGETKQSIVCPMGVQAATNNPVLQNISVPVALMPTWQLLRKYVINVDAQTIILDNNRTKLSLSNLQVGDQLNVYGNTADNGQTLNADIVRDLSIPATPSTYNGKVMQVNADGSFVIQTNDGQTMTVQNPIQVGATVQLTGLLDRLKNILKQVSNISFVLN